MIDDEKTCVLDESPGSGPDSPELSLAVQLTRKGNKNMTLYNRDVDLTSSNGTEENGGGENDMSNGGYHSEAAMDGGHTVVIENPPQGLVHFGVNQGHSPQLLLRLERGKSKPLKKKSNFSAIVSNVFGIGGKRESANLVRRLYFLSLDFPSDFDFLRRKMNPISMNLLGCVF